MQCSSIHYSCVEHFMSLTSDFSYGKALQRLPSLLFVSLLCHCPGAIRAAGLVGKDISCANTALGNVPAFRMDAGAAQLGWQQSVMHSGITGILGKVTSELWEWSFQPFVELSALVWTRKRRFQCALPFTQTQMKLLWKTFRNCCGCYFIFWHFSSLLQIFETQQRTQNPDPSKQPGLISSQQSLAALINVQHHQHQDYVQGAESCKDTYSRK